MLQECPNPVCLLHCDKELIAAFSSASLETSAFFPSTVLSFVGNTGKSSGQGLCPKDEHRTGGGVVQAEIGAHRGCSGRSGPQARSPGCSGGSAGWIFTVIVGYQGSHSDERWSRNADEWGLAGYSVGENGSGEAWIAGAVSPMQHGFQTDINQWVCRVSPLAGMDALENFFLLEWMFLEDF